jgi:hypothetical protein
MGELHNIVVDGANLTDWINAAAGYKDFGPYYMPGLLGQNSTLDDAWFGANPYTRAVTLNKFSVLHHGETAYSRSAVATMISVRGEGEMQSAVDSLQFDMGGRIVAEYGSTGTLNMTHYTPNPIKHALDLLMNPRYGMNFTEPEIDFAQQYYAWNHLNETRAGPVADIDVNRSSTSEFDYYLTTGSADDYYIGQTVNYSGTNDSFSSTVNGIFGSSVLNLSHSLAYAQRTATDQILGIVSRNENHLYISDSNVGPQPLHDILRTCNGYMTYDAETVQLRVEQATDTNTAHYRDTGYAAGYGIVEGSFKWMTLDTDRNDPSINRVVAIYSDSDNVSRRAVATDYDHLDTHPLIDKVIDVPGVKSKWHAYSLAKLELDKHRVLKTGAQFTVGQVGLLQQPGDRISVTHTVPNWTAQPKRIYATEVIGLGDNDEFLVRLTVDDYSSTIYSDATPPGTDHPVSGEYTINLTSQMESSGNVILSWNVTGDNALLPRLVFDTYKSAASIGDPPNPRYKLNRDPIAEWRYSYQPTASEVGADIYFRVRGRHDGLPKMSNEIVVVPTNWDPSDSGDASPFNLIGGGDFQNAYQWSGREPQDTSSTLPDNSSDSGGTDHQYGTRTLAYDNDTTTSALRNEQVLATQTETIGSCWDSWGTGLDVQGYFQVKHGLDSGGVKIETGCAQRLYYSTNSGVDWSLFSTISPKPYSIQGAAPIVSISESFIVDDLSNLVFRSIATLVGKRFGIINLTAHVYEIEFINFSGGDYARVANNMGSLNAENTTGYPLYRPYPGVNPASDDQIVHFSGSTNVCTLAVKKIGSGTPGGVDIYLRNSSDGEEWPMMTIPGADINTTWEHHALQWSPESNILGSPLEVCVRLNSTSNTPVQVDKAAVYRGSTAWAWTPNVEEMRGGYHGDGATGLVSSYTSGRWISGVRRTARVTGSLK